MLDIPVFYSLHWDNPTREVKAFLFGAGPNANTSANTLVLKPVLTTFNDFYSQQNFIVPHSLLSHGIFDL